MKIMVLGAAGKAGSRVVAEAMHRGHEVIAVVRNSTDISNLPAEVEVVRGDAAKVEDIVRLSTGQDVVVSAIRPVPSDEVSNTLTTLAIMDGLAQTGVRLLVVGGAATLSVPGTGGRTVLEDEHFLPVSARPVGQASANQLQACLRETRVDWAYLSPAANFAPGNRTGNYRVGTDALLLDAKGNSTISMEDMAIALIDEVERPKHHKKRFTVAY